MSNIVIFDDGKEFTEVEAVYYKHNHPNLSFMIWPREVYDRIQKHKQIHVDH